MKDSVIVSILAIASFCAAQFDPEQCGPRAGNQRCSQNKCCSQYGWCGSSNAYCQVTQGCQTGFGRCTGVLSTAVASPSASAASISRNGRCGSAFGGQTCKGSKFGDCCSTYNWCGKTENHCKASLGCRLGFGTCTGVQSSSILVPLSQSSSSQSSSSLTTLSTRTSLSSSGSGTTASSHSSQSSNSSPIVTPPSASQSSSTSISSTGTSASSSLLSIVTSSSSSSAVSSSSVISYSSFSSFISSRTTTLASPSMSPVSSTNTPTTLSSASGSATVITHVLRATRNPSVDRTAPEHLVPKNVMSFFFTEDGTSYTTSVQASLDSGARGVLLENIAGISSVTCSGSTINLQFSDETSANAARSWPEGTILFTLSDGCNTVTERGVYRLGATAATSAAQLRIRATSVAQATNFWSFSLEALLIQMEAVIANYDELKRMAAEAAATASTSISVQITSTVSSATVSSSTGAQSSASATPLPACGGYAPGGRFNIAGTSYQISCTLAGTWRERWIDFSYQESFTACMAYCNANAQCVVASWNEQQVSNGKYMCLRWALLPFKTDNAANAPMAVKVVSSSSVTNTVTLVTSTVSVSASVSSSSTRDSPTASPSA